MVSRSYRRRGLSICSGSIHAAFIFTVIAAWFLNGCTKSITTTNRYAVTKLQPGATVLFFLDSQSTEKSGKMERRVVRSMTRALEEANAYAWVLSSKEFCPDVVEPFYTPKDILLLLQDAPFKQKIKAKRIKYIVLVSVLDLSRGWSTNTHGEFRGLAVYNKRETEHSVSATVLDPEKAEIAGVLFAHCSASSGYGVGAGAGGGSCCVFPFAWYGGETEDLSIRTVAADVAKFLTDKDAAPNSKRPGDEAKAAIVQSATDSKASEEEPKAESFAPASKPELMKRIKLRDRPEKNFSDQDLQKMIWERNFFNAKFNPGGNFLNAFLDNGDGTVTDKATGLMWQKGGSPAEMTFEAAGKYVHKLNSIRFGGYSNWRLPTMEELCSLLEEIPNKAGKFMDNLFDPEQGACWSADDNPRYSGTINSWRVKTAFGVDFIRAETSSGIADRFLASAQNPQSRYHVKAVRTVD